MNQELNLIQEGKTSLGIEFGSTRIKAVLTDLGGNVLCTGSYSWENSLIDNIWTYSLEEIHAGLRGAYTDLNKHLEEKYGDRLSRVGALGISAMMHGYMAFDAEGKLLAPFQTWRNSNTGKAADVLTDLFGFHIPLRWSVAHLYQRILDKEPHVQKIDYVATLAAYIHWLLSGQRVIGIGDASGMFPIDSVARDYDQAMVDKFDKVTGQCGFSQKLRDIFPKVLTAGTCAGHLTEEGARLLDESGRLEAGALMAPPEGDAGTGMTATNAVRPGTGNTSAGTSTFAMLVMDKGLSKLYRQIDMVTTPAGDPAAMAHANNGTTDINSWMGLFGEVAKLMGHDIPTGDLFTGLFRNSLKGDKDCDGLLSIGYYSGEGITEFDEGRPLFVKYPDSRMNAANFVRNLIYSSFAAVKLGMDILKEEGAVCKSMTGHGGLFATEGVAETYLAAAIDAPVTVMENASEGGPWGMALLGAFTFQKEKEGLEMKLEDFLDQIFAKLQSRTVQPKAEDVRGFDEYMKNYTGALQAERAAVSGYERR